ncbi:MAG: UDP-N-acetylglucosamine 1-carboxyvinyltransferase, partial [Clostridia bacterium]|nr:UDP-N-acetylglucosamine 1-carboxyvinyltransferase [Clostridia bacterium]
MDYLKINGRKALRGEVDVSGGKNAALAIIAASVLAGGPVQLENVPYIEDVMVARDILLHLGANVGMPGGGMMFIDAARIQNQPIPEKLSGRMRASYYFCPALLTRFGEGAIAMPGGCAIGERKIDQTVRGISALGACVTDNRDMLEAYAPPGGMQGAEVYMDCVSVGATINTMLAAVKANGVTSIFNAAREPHIVDVANFLNSMGAQVRGAGTAIIRVTGVDNLRGTRYTVVPDQIETGTMMIAAAATGGDVVVKGAIPVHMEALNAKLTEAGCMVTEYDDAIRVVGPPRPKPANVTTLPYPGFPTDLQQPFTTMLTVANGTSIVNETVFDSRFRYLNELRRMGAHYTLLDRVALVEGVEALSPARVHVPDLRAGAALVVAGLMAEGETLVGNVHY